MNNKNFNKDINIKDNINEDKQNGYKHDRLYKRINIYRHAFSCSNEKYYLSQKDNYFKDLRYPDPSLTIWGIDSGNKYYYSIAKKSYMVFVSCLLRTWLTAILLFMPRSKFCFFSLVISPFLKESSTSEPNTGTGKPIQFKDQIVILGDFIKVCNNMNIKLNGILNLKFFGTDTNYKFFINDGNMISLNPKQIFNAPYNKYSLNISRRYNDLISDKMIQQYNNNLKTIDNKIYKIIVKENILLKNNLVTSYIADKDYLSSDIEKFIDVLNVFYPNLKEVNVIAHNNIMKRFLKQMNTEVPEEYSFIIHQNIWNIELDLLSDIKIDKVKIQSGVSKPLIDTIIPECEILCNFKPNNKHEESNICINKLK